MNRKDRLVQKRLFAHEQDRLKLQQTKKVERLTRGYFDKLLRKGFDPGYILKIEQNEMPRLADVMLKTSEDPEGFGLDVQRFKAVVLVKAGHENNRRIIAKDTSSDWLWGLWISLLRRQLKCGDVNTQAWSYGKLVDLDIGLSTREILDKWQSRLIQKEPIL